MTTDTGAQAGVSNDVEARAREVIATSLIGRRVPVNKHGRVDDIGIGGQVGRQFSSLALTALTAANLRIVSAEADDRRTEAIRAFEEFVHVIDGGASMGIDHGLSAGFARRKLAPYLHDDDTGGEG